MAGSGVFDRNDRQLIKQLARQVENLADEMERQNDAREAAEDGQDEPLEQEAFEDLDAIAEISEHAIAELETGDLDELEGSLQEIHERATVWADPDVTTEGGEQ